DVALGLTAEAVEEAAVDVHVEAGRLLAVEGAQALELRLAGRFEAHDLADDVGDVQALADHLLGVDAGRIGPGDGHQGPPPPEVGSASPPAVLSAPAAPPAPAPAAGSAGNSGR